MWLRVRCLENQHDRRHLSGWSGHKLPQHPLATELESKDDRSQNSKARRIAGTRCNNRGDSTNDHNAIKKLLATLTQAEPVNRRSALERLKAALVVHNATEENLVYPALAVNAGEKTESVNLFHETAEADTLIFTIDQMLAVAPSDFIANAKNSRPPFLSTLNTKKVLRSFILRKRRAKGKPNRLLLQLLPFVGRSSFNRRFSRVRHSGALYR